MMSISLLQPSFFMSKTRSYAKMEWKRSRFFLTAMAIHCCLRVAPLDLQQGGNSRIPYVHVPAARMSIVVYIATAINTFFFLLTKHPFFFALPDFVYYRNGCFFYVLDLSYWGVSGKTYVGHLLGVGCSFNLSMNLVPYLPGCTAFSKASCRTGFNPCWTDIPIIKSSVNWWNTSHQPGSISRSGTSIHVPMLIPILSNLTHFLFSTPIFFVLETRLPIPEFLESPLTEEIEAREGIPKPSSLAESLHPWLNG